MEQRKHSFIRNLFIKEDVGKYNNYKTRLTYNNYIYQNGTKYYETVLVDNKDSSSEERKIFEEEKKFDLYNFFIGKGASTGGIGLITPNQTIIADTFIRSKSDPKYGDHGTNIQYVYKVLYGNEVNVQANHPIFQYSVLIDGNVLIQFCIGCSSVIWIPHKINDYQRQELIKLNEKIKNVYNMAPEYFDSNPMEFDVGNADENIKCINNLDAYFDKDKENSSVKIVQG